MAFVDAVDSIYQYAKGRILTLNPSRVVAGILAAQDWPPKPVKLNAFYLIDQGEAPNPASMYSAQVPVKFHQLVWIFVIKGTDLVQGEVIANRGDRFRTMQQMKGELINGLFPNFCQKFTWALQGEVWTAQPIGNNTPEMITWTPVAFHEQLDKESGVMQGTGTIRVWDMTDPIFS